MSKFVEDVQGFFGFFNNLRKNHGWAFYPFVTIFALGIAAAVGSVLLLGVTPALALSIAFGGLYLGAVAGYLGNVYSEGMHMTAVGQQRFLIEFRKNHPILYWGLLTSLILSPVVVGLFAFIPALAAFVTGNAVAKYLGITAALSSSSLYQAMVGVAIWTSIAGSFILQGVVDIAKDIGSCFGRGHASRKSSQKDSEGLLAYYDMPEKEPHPATTYSHGKPVFGAGGKPAAQETTSPAVIPAPSFGMGSSASQQ